MLVTAHPYEQLFSSTQIPCLLLSSFSPYHSLITEKRSWTLAGSLSDSPSQLFAPSCLEYYTVSGNLIVLCPKYPLYQILSSPIWRCPVSWLSLTDLGSIMGMGTPASGQTRSETNSHGLRVKFALFSSLLVRSSQLRGLDPEAGISKQRKEWLDRKSSWNPV